MLHLTIIGIVCAVSAPCEGTAIIGRKNSGSVVFCDFAEGARNGTKPFLPRVHNVGGVNSSLCAKQKITNRTSCFNCDYINKQYQNSRSSSYSVKENVSSGKEKEFLHSDVGLGFRKRNLLWKRKISLFSPKTLQPPMNFQNKCDPSVLSDSSSEKCRCEKPKCPRPRGKCKKPRCRCRKKKIKKKKCKSEVQPETYSLNCKDKKKFLRLKKLKGKSCKRHLDRVRIDDELDLNKRIEKLVGEIAAENQRTATAEVTSPTTTDQSGEAASPSGECKPAKKLKFPFFKRLKKIFRFSKGKSKDKKPKVDHFNSVPVNIVRGKDPVADKAALINSFDHFKTARKATRFRRNPYRNYVSFSHGINPATRRREREIVQPHAYSAHFKGKLNFLYPTKKHKLITQIKTRHHRLLYGSQHGIQQKPAVGQIPMDIRPKRHNQRSLEQSLSNGQQHKPGFNLNQDSAAKSSDEAKSADRKTLKTDLLGGSGGENDSPASETTSEECTTDNLTPPDIDQGNQEDIPDVTLEKPFLEGDSRFGVSEDKTSSADLKTYEDRYNLQTDFPLFNPTTVEPYGKYTYNLPDDGILNPYRYLKIRHALRNYLIHNKILVPTGLDISTGRRKRCGKCCPLPHKCWRSPPLLCIPYIRKGQDDLLRYLIRIMQRMIGKPFPPKMDIFESTKFKPCSRTGADTCDDSTEFDCCTMSTPPCTPCTPPCMPVPPCPQPPCPTSRRCPMETSKLCSYSPPVFTFPRLYPSSSRPCLTAQRSCPCENYSVSREYSPPSRNSYSTSSPYSYSYSTAEETVYSTPNYDYDQFISPAPSAYIPSNLYSQSSLTSGELPFRSFPVSNSLRAEANFAPTPPSNAFPRALDQAPASFTRPPIGFSSTMNACSWYLSKSPVERAEYFSYTALPYIAASERSVAPSQFPQSEPFRPVNYRLPCGQPNLQDNRLNPQKFNGEWRSSYTQLPPVAMQFAGNPQSATDRYVYENQYQYRDKHNNGDFRPPYDLYPDQTNQFRKENNARRNFQVYESPVKDNTQGMITCDDQLHRINENQMLKPEANLVYPRNGLNKENIQNAYRCPNQQDASNDRQMSRADANTGYEKSPNKEQNPGIVPNAQQAPLPEANDCYNKNLNREDAYRCGYQQSPANALQQLPRPETNLKYPKNAGKGNTFKCNDQHHSANVPQLSKPDVTDDGDEKRFFKTKHHKSILKNFRRPATEFSQAYDYDYYDRFPSIEPEEDYSLRYKAPFLRTWRGYSRKVKKNLKRGSSVRQKRGNDYASPENFESYNDYDVNYNDAALDDSVRSEEAAPDPNWTPPSYEMFSELAKAVTELMTAVDNTTSSNPSNSSRSKVTAAAATRSLGSSLAPLGTASPDDITFKIKEDVIKKSSNVTTKLNSTISTINNAERSTAANSNATANNTSPKSLSTISTPTITFTENTSDKTTTAGSLSEMVAAAITSTNATSANATTTAAPSNTTTTATSTTAVSATTTSAVTADTTKSSSESDTDYDNDESLDSKKSGKTGFFQTNSKSQGIQSNSKYQTPGKMSNLGSGREDKELDGNQDLDSADEGQVPTTLKTASIVKGPKKSMTKPSPKVYTRVYPDSVPFDTEVNETTTTTAGTTAKTVVEKATQGIGSSSNIQLRLLAVCEGYLEVVKLIKAQNQTLGEDLDAELARYCENIISQNFNLQSESSKPKKQESVAVSSSPPPPSRAGNSTKTSKTTPDPDSKPDDIYSDVTSYADDISEDEVTEREIKIKPITDILSSSVNKRELIEGNKRKKGKRKRLKYVYGEDTNEDIRIFGGETESPSRRKKNNKSRQVTRLNFKSHRKKRKKYRRKKQTEEEMSKKSIKKEQELLHLLKKRKKALLSRLYNSKDAPMKSSDVQETEYFDDGEEIASGSNMPSYSGTITPKELEETSKTTESERSFVNESIFPVYAKEYGYDRGGELTEVEVLWRKINEKTHEKKIFKNLSVLALLLTSTVEPNVNREDTRFLGSGLENEELNEIHSKSENKAGYADAVANFNKKTSTAPTIGKIKNASAVNNTYTFISKPDPRSIVGSPPNATRFHSNTTRKISHKFGAAKDLFQEYTIEFLNYAVYILPIMFTVLFVFCCLCCAIQILKSRKPSKKHKMKKKRPVSTESETTESERESKKKRRESRRKKYAKESAEYEALAKKRSKTFWNVLRRSSGKGNPEFNEDSQTEKKKSFLRFLKGRKDDGKAEFSSRYAPVHETDENRSGKHTEDSDGHYQERRRKDEKPKTYSQSEAEERRELIALLEELKKIETENTGEKKEVKSVHVQYMTQEDDTPVFQRPEFGFPYQKNVFGMPKGCSPCNKHFPFYQSDPAAVRDYELFEDVNELTELLPCDCNYYAKRNDYLRHCDFKINREGGCKSFIKIFRDAGVTRSTPFREKNLFKNENENRSFIFNKYRSISTDTSEELMGVTQKNAGTEVRLTDNVYESASPLKLQSKKNAGLVEEMDSLKRQLNNKKHVRLKDNGVLCRL